MTPANVRAYADALCELPPVEVAESVRRLIRTSEFPPTIAAVYRETVERLLELPGEAEAVDQLSRAGADGGELHSLVREARAAVGDSWKWKTTERPDVLIGRAARVYADLRERAVRAVIAEPGRLATPALGGSVRRAPLES